MVQQMLEMEETEEELVARARDAARRLDAVLDRLRGTRPLDPAVLRQLVATINGGVLAAAEDYHRMLERQWRAQGIATACSTACWASNLHCPRSEALLLVVEELRAAGFEDYHDDVEERVARETRCLCSAAMTYIGLQRGSQIKAWVMCAGCGHWMPL